MELGFIFELVLIYYVVFIIEVFFIFLVIITISGCLYYLCCLHFGGCLHFNGCLKKSNGFGLISILTYLVFSLKNGFKRLLLVETRKKFPYYRGASLFLEPFRKIKFWDDEIWNTFSIKKLFFKINFPLKTNRALFYAI